MKLHICLVLLVLGLLCGCGENPVTRLIQRPLSFEVRMPQDSGVKNLACDTLFASLLEKTIRGDVRSSALLAHVEAGLLTKDSVNVAALCTEGETGKTTLERFGLRAIHAVATLQHTLPGIPVLSKRQNMMLGDSSITDPGIQEVYLNLKELKVRFTCLQTGSYTPLGAMMMSGSAAGFLREDDQSIVAVMINLQNRPVTNVKFAIHPELKKHYTNQMVTNLSDSSGVLPVTDLYLEQLLPFEAVIFAAKK